jgi:aldehyde:ferredoxin oxidoreductase
MFCVQDPNSPMTIGGLRPLGILQPVPEADFGPKRMAITIAGHSRSLVTDSLCTCAFTGVNAVDTLAAVTSWDVTVSELHRVGERILTAARLFNLKQGLTDADDVLPERFFQPKTDGPLSNRPLNRETMEKARGHYYTLMGWDNAGVPLPAKVAELYIE